jgi:hypothetical protein
MSSPRPPAPKQVLSNRIMQLMERVRRKRRSIPVEWSCGHNAGATCRECYRALAWRAHELAEENLRLAEENLRLRGKVL